MIQSQISTESIWFARQQRHDGPFEQAKVLQVQEDMQNMK